jgi:hypothetical protein
VINLRGCFAEFLVECPLEPPGSQPSFSSLMNSFGLDNYFKNINEIILVKSVAREKTGYYNHP